MANTLTGLIPTLYMALDTVSREQVGFIPAVGMDAASTIASVGQIVRSPIAPVEAAIDISPSVSSPDAGDATISYADITISKSKMVPVRFTGEDEVGLKSGGTFEAILSGRFAQAFRTLTNLVETDIASLYTKASRAYGAAGTTPFGTTIGETAHVRRILEENGAPTGDMHLILNSMATANLRSLGQLTSANTAGTDETLRKGIIGDLNGLFIGTSNAVVTHTKGTGASGTTNTAGYAIGATVITLASAGTGTILAGDVITFAGDNNYYVVLSGDVDISSGGTITIAAPGLKKAIAGSATAITVIGTSTRNMAFNRGAIQLITRAPARPSVGDLAADVTYITDPISGITYEISMYMQNRQVQYQVGLAWGYAAIKPEHIALLLG